MTVMRWCFIHVAFWCTDVAGTCPASGCRAVMTVSYTTTGVFTEYMQQTAGEDWTHTMKINHRPVIPVSVSRLWSETTPDALVLQREFRAFVKGHLQWCHSSCTVGNVGTRFWKGGRLCGINRWYLRSDVWTKNCFRHRIKWHDEEEISTSTLLQKASLIHWQLFTAARLCLSSCPQWDSTQLTVMSSTSLVWIQITCQPSFMSPNSWITGKWFWLKLN